MRKMIFALVLCMTVGLFAAPSHAGQVNNLNEPGSLLAYPLIDNINGVTIVNVANTGSVDAVLECYMVTHGEGARIDEKKDFIIKLTPKEKFVWITSKAYNHRANQIQAFDGRKGYMFCYAIDNVHSQREIKFNHLKGDATVLELSNARAFNYNAIPHQGLQVDGDRVLRLDGNEYTKATSQIMFEGLAEIPNAIYGTLVVASPGIDFVLSRQPAFDINVFCWNEVETKFSRHLGFRDFEQYDLTSDLQLDIHSIFTLGFHCATSSTNPLWAVFHQNLATVMAWGGNVFQHPATGVAASIVLPDVPLAQ